MLNTNSHILIVLAVLTGGYGGYAMLTRPERLLVNHSYWWKWAFVATAPAVTLLLAFFPLTTTNLDLILWLAFFLLAIATFLGILGREIYFFIRDQIRNSQPPSPPTPDEMMARARHFAEMALTYKPVPPALRAPITSALLEYATKHGLDGKDLSAFTMASAINHLLEVLPPPAILKVTERGTSWNTYMQAAWKGSEDVKVIQTLDTLKGMVLSELLKIRFTIEIPDDLRTRHMMIVSGSGHGKTTLIEHLFYQDLATDAAIVVIDSQNDLIDQLAVRVPPERLILIDPTHCPPALNVFANTTSDTATATDLFLYAFSALEAGLTSKQEMVYRFLSRLLFAVKGNLTLMVTLLQRPELLEEHQATIDRLGEPARLFFEEYRRPKNQYAETRQEIVRRLLTLLENPTFALMLNADSMSLDIAKALDEGKVILVNTDKRNLKQTGASLLGRIFIAQVMQAVIARETTRRRTYLYLDEFGSDYADDSPPLLNLFEQGRKYGLGMTVAFQQLSQLTLKLSGSLSANTAIKFAGGVSANDLTALAKQMRCEPEFIDGTPVGTFTLAMANYGAYHYKVTIDRPPVVTTISAVRDAMRARYSPLPSRVDTPQPPKKAEIEPRTKGEGRGVVEEKGDW